MIIEDNRNMHEEDLYDISYGECFIYDYELYMKVKADHLFAGFDRTLCVNMDDGICESFENFLKVTRVSSKVVIA